MLRMTCISVSTIFPTGMVKRSTAHEVFSFPEDLSYAGQIARLIRAPLCRVSTHQFPDGETLASIRQRRPRSDAILVRRLDHPNPKIADTLFIADALRRSGALEITLGVPYFPYLRQDKVFHDGEGDRIHDDAASLQRFADAISRTSERGGVVVIPSYAVDRTEVVLHHLARLRDAGRIPRIPTFVDSPMALAALRIYEESIERGTPEIRDDIARAKNCFDDQDLTEIKSVEESIRLNSMQGPMIIISASGMASGGRVLHHLKRRLPDRRNTVILVGYQTEGTRGRSLLDGAPMVKMLGDYVPVAAEIVDVPAFSSHADQAEIVNWLKLAKVRPRIIYVVHGEPAASELCAPA